MLTFQFVSGNFVRTGCFLVGAVATITLGFGNQVAGAEADHRVDFNRQIRSILSDKCFLCHGPDESTRESGLRLDVRDDAIESGALVPGKPNESELLARILSDDPDEVMPPPGTGKTVTAKERLLIQQWIDQDAPYDKHWAFVSPKMPELPPVKNQSWSRNAIDRFVLARMESMGATPSVEADPATLARRLKLDLTGLPPTIDELDQIEQSNDPNAKLNDFARQWTTSPQFGERWARWWLDAARYADSAGYEKDMQREVFFYRDWVIDAMNRDLAYDQFVIQQVAGDLLPGAGQNERVATGFLRNSMTNEEGGANAEQFRVEGMFDRVDAIGKAVLGLTTQCAQCHTHKYDPLSHHEYYQMFAALNDFHEACITVYTPEQSAKRDAIRSAIAREEAALRNQIPQWRIKVRRWATEMAATMPQWRVIKPTDIPFGGQKFNVLEDGSIVSQSYAPTKVADDFSVTTDIGTITAVRLDALTHDELPRRGPGRSIDGTGALTEFKLTIQPTAKDAKPINVKFTRAISDVNAPQSDLKPQYRDRERDKDKRVVGPIDYAIDGDEKTAWTTDIGPGRSNRSRYAIFVPESPIVIDGEAKLTFTMVQKHGGWNSDDNQNFLVGRYRFSVTDSPTIPNIAIDASVEPMLKLTPTQWTDRQWAQLFNQWRRLPEQLESEDGRFVDTDQRIEDAWQAFPATATQLVARSLAKPRETFVFARGDFLKPTERVQADAPEFLNPMPKDSSPDRLRFAKWLVSKDSPTTARVIVNRIWQAYFGRGLVATPEDFGFQSVSPSHPELLDYLARELMDNGWSLKHIHGLIVDSATYRQSSLAAPEAWREDTNNQWLTRGPRFRMEAEMVRDLALSASGLLDPMIGGPSVYPPAPEFLFMPPTSYGPKIWDTDESVTQYRRSIYVHQYRSIPYPPLQVFDAPKGDAACVRRERSNTPLQALVMLNEPQFLHAARALATRVLRESGDAVGIGADELDRLRIARAFQACTSRHPADDEVSILAELLRCQRLQFESQSADEVGQWLGVPPDTCRQLTGVDATEMAAWMVVTRAILNLDETISKS